ncbi:MAG: general secretion pathway protein D [Candidatus Azotimanducaceae bacterium]|jgi:general secretion pathway protein D
MHHIVRLLVISCLLVAPFATGQDNWKINLKNADIREFTTQVSAITGKSFIVDPRIKGNVTVISSTSMDSDAIYELFLSVLRVHGYAAVESGNVVKIVQQVLAKQSGNSLDFVAGAESEELVTRVIAAKNTPSVELVKILRPLIPQYGHIAGLDQPNAIIISDHASNINRLVEIVERIDVVEETTTRIVELKEAWVEDMVGLLEQLAPDLIGKGAKGPNKITIVASERTNSIVLKGEPLTLEKVVQLIADLDTPANRAGTIQVVRLAHSDATELADILKNLVADSDSDDKTGQNVKTSIQADAALNALVIRADPTTMSDLKSIIAQLDIRRLQVLIEAAIVEVTDTFERQLGTELAIADTGSSNIPVATTAPSGILSSIIASLATNGATVPNLGTSPILALGKEDANGINFAFVVQALASNDNANLLSTPSITTMDNEEAKIVVGQSVPFRTGSTTTGNNGTSNPFTTIQREDVGLTLQVTPHVHDGNLIRLEILQEVSEVDTRTLQIGSDGSSDIITNKRTIETTVLADDGEVVVLGGLIRDKYSEGESGVPGLKNIPVLGYLFKTKSKSVEKSNLMVFLRATVLKTREDVVAQTERKYSGIWEVEITGTEASEAINDLFDGKH